MAPSPYWGDKPIWDSQTSTHNQMMDAKGRVWAAARVRPDGSGGVLLDAPRRIARSAHMQIDAASRESLELTRAASGGVAGSLLGEVDRCVTPGGRRLLCADLSAPLSQKRAIDERLPRRLHERPELLDGRLAELRRRVSDEVFPELPGVLLARLRRRWRGEVDEVFHEAHRLKPATPRCLGCKDDPVAASAKDIADPDAIVRRAVGRLRHEQDGERLRHHAPRG